MFTELITYTVACTPMYILFFYIKCKLCSVQYETSRSTSRMTMCISNGMPIGLEITLTISGDESKGPTPCLHTFECVRLFIRFNLTSN